MVEWRDLPPKIGRRRIPEPDQIRAGIRIRQQIEQSRRERGIPPEGTIYPGEIVEDVPRRRRKDPR